MKFDIERIYKLLKDSKKNQSDFLVDAGLSKGVVSHWSKRNNPKIEQLEKLLNYYGKSVLEVYEMNELDCKHVLHNLDDIIEKSFAPLPKSNAISLTSSHSIQFAPLVGQAAANPAGRLGVDVEENLGEIPTRWPIPPGCEDPNGFKLEGVTSENAANLDIKFDDKAGDLADAYFDANGNLIVSGLAKGNYTTILTVTYKKAVEFGNTTVHETFQIPLNVQGVE